MHHQTSWKHSERGDPIWISDEKEGYIEAEILDVHGNDFTNLKIEICATGERICIDTSSPRLRSSKPHQKRKNHSLIQQQQQQQPPSGAGEFSYQNAQKNNDHCVLPRSIHFSTTTTTTTTTITAKDNTNDSDNIDNLMNDDNNNNKSNHHHHQNQNHKIIGVENMDDLTPLNEASILANINVRFQMDHIYTRTGPILIAMNPFKWLPNYYEDQIIQSYHNKKYGEMAPHCFQEAEDAYQKLIHTGQNQSIIICGESGAGKTETTKLMLKYLSIVARGDNNTTDNTTTNDNNNNNNNYNNNQENDDNTNTKNDNNNNNNNELTLGERLVQSNPLMESFGNAKTIRNNNSSRFGKFTLINFASNNTNTNHQQQHSHHLNHQHYRISGGKVSNFLLEKSRVVNTPLNERNYHIFYQLCAGLKNDADLASKFLFSQEEIMDLNQFHYLNQSDCICVEGINDEREFQQTKQSMTTIDIEEKQQEWVFGIIAAILHLGNVDFQPEADDEECSLKNETLLMLTKAATLLGLDSTTLLEALTTRVRKLPGDKMVTSPQTVIQSRDSRDALSKAIYEKLFDWLVMKMNETFDKDQSGKHKAKFIGILDIFGFEDLSENGFEQLFINFTNEKLQALFNEATFKKEEEEYTLEQIQWDRTDYPDNQICIDLLEKKPLGLLPFMDSECTRGNAATDAGLVSKWHKAHKVHPNYGVCGPSTNWRFRDNSWTEETDFAIIHYAGPVIYSCEDFIEKNRDALFDHVNKMIHTSSNKFLQTLFDSSQKDDINNKKGNDPHHHSLLSQKRSSAAADFASLRAGSSTVANRFTTQLSTLIQQLTSCETRFVRCIKSNPNLQPQTMDKPSVLKQLICSGVMAALEVRRAGFPSRILYEDFVKEFRVFSTNFPKTHLLKDLKHQRTESQLAIAEEQLQFVSEQNDDDIDEGSSPKVKNRLLTAYMMTHPVVVDAVESQQYRLGVTKLFLHADILFKLETIKNHMILPNVLRIQKWWIKISKNILGTKMTSVTNLLNEFVNKSEKGNVTTVTFVKKALHEAQNALHHTKSVGIENLDNFRPAIRTAYKKVNTFGETVNKAIKYKDMEITQRIELLKKLDTARANISDINKTLSVDIVLLNSKESIQKLIQKTSSSIEERYNELNNTKTDMIDNTNVGEFLANRKENADKTLALVSQIEHDFQDILSEQAMLDQSRSLYRANLNASLQSFEHEKQKAKDAGVQNVQVVSLTITTTKDIIQSAEDALVEHDISQFESAVSRASVAVEDLGMLINKERKIKEEEDRRKEGKDIINSAIKRLQQICKNAEYAHVDHVEAFKNVVKHVEAEIESISSLATSDTFAYVSAANAVHDKVDLVENVLNEERIRIETNNMKRAAEFARLEPSIDVFTDLQASLRKISTSSKKKDSSLNDSNEFSEIHESFEKTIHLITSVTTELEISENVTTLSSSIDEIIERVKEADNLYNNARMKYEANLQELSTIKKDLLQLSRRIEAIKTQASGASSGAGIIADLTEKSIMIANNAIQDADRLLRKNDIETTKYALTDAERLVKAAEDIFNEQKQSVMRAEKDRFDEINHLDTAVQHLDAVKVTIINNELEENSIVIEALEKIESGVRFVRDRFEKPITVAWILNNELKQDINAVKDITDKIDSLETIVIEETRNLETFQYDARVNQSNLELASQKLESNSKMVSEYSLMQYNAVELILEECEVEFTSAQTQIYDESIKDPEIGRRALRKLNDLLNTAEETILRTKTIKETSDKEKVGAQNKFDIVTTKFQGIVAMINAAGPIVKQMTDNIIMETSEEINNTTKLLRRGDDIPAFTAAVLSASDKVNETEETALKIKDKADKALKVRSTASMQVGSLCETLSLCSARAESNKLKENQDVNSALIAAEGSLTLARKRTDGEITSWMDDASSISRLIDEAARKVEFAEEIVDEELQTKERIDRNVQEVWIQVEGLIARHKAICDEAFSCGISRIDAVQRVVATCETEIKSVSEVIDSGNVPTLFTLIEMLKNVESVCHTERNKKEMRQVDYVKAAGELPALQNKLESLDNLIDATGSPMETLVKNDREAACKAVTNLESFVKDPDTTFSPILPLLATAISKVAKFERLVNQKVEIIEKMRRRRNIEIEKLKQFDEKFKNLQGKIASLCSASDHLRVQLDADWSESGQCWYGAQTNHSSTDGSPIGRGEMKPVSSIQLITQTLASTEKALITATRKVEADVATWLEVGIPPVHRIMEDTSNKISTLERLIDDEQFKLEREKKDRKTAEDQLRSFTDRLSTIRIRAEESGTDKTPATREAVQAADRAINVVLSLIEAGNIAAAPPAMKVSKMKIDDAEQAVFQAIQRKDRYDAQRDIAKSSLKQMQNKMISLKETTEALNLDEKSVKESFLQAEKTIDAAYDAIEKEYGIAVINKEVTLALQTVEAVDRSITQERTRKEEVAKTQQKRSETEQIKKLQEVQRQYERETEEMNQRIALQHQVNTIRNKVLLAKAQIEEMNRKVIEAEEALELAQEKVTNGGIDAAQAAVQEAMAKNTESSFMLGGESSVLSIPLPLLSSSISEDGMTTPLRTSAKNENQGKVVDNSIEEQGWMKEYVHSSNNYMDRQTNAVEALTANIHFLTQGLLSLSDTVQHQAQVMDAQNELISGEGDKDDLSHRLQLLQQNVKTENHDHHAHNNKLDHEDKMYQQNHTEELLEINSINVSVLDDSIDDSIDDDDDESSHKSHHSNPNSPRRNRKLFSKEEDNSNKAMEDDNQKVKESNLFTIQSLLSKYYSSDIYEELKGRQTKGGVTLEDCIAKESLSSGQLEVFAGDNDSYCVFAPLFDPIIQAYNPKFENLSNSSKSKTKAISKSLLNSKYFKTMNNPDPMGNLIDKTRIVISRNISGIHFTPKMSLKQLYHVENLIKTIVEQSFEGPLHGTYLSMKQVLADEKIQRDLEECELPQTYRVMENASRLSQWPEGRGIFINHDKSLCIFVNIEDHVTIVCSKSKSKSKNKKDNNNNNNIKSSSCNNNTNNTTITTNTNMIQDVILLGNKVLGLFENSPHITFVHNPNLGYLTPSPAKLGTSLAFSLGIPIKSGMNAVNLKKRIKKIMKKYDIRIDLLEKQCLIYNKHTLGISEEKLIYKVIKGALALEAQAPEKPTKPLPPALTINNNNDKEGVVVEEEVLVEEKELVVEKELLAEEEEVVVVSKDSQDLPLPLPLPLPAAE